MYYVCHPEGNACARTVASRARVCVVYFEHPHMHAHSGMTAFCYSFSHFCLFALLPHTSLISILDPALWCVLGSKARLHLDQRGSVAY